MWRAKKKPEPIPCPNCKRTDRWVLVAQFHSMDTELNARVESVRLACENCQYMGDVTRNGATVEVRPARPKQEAPPDKREHEKDSEPLDSDLKGLYGNRNRMPRR